mgnify:CR=1 FL=1
MAGVTGITDSKLFKVKRIDLDEPYKVGVNGVVSINEINDTLNEINYVVDNILYTTTIPKEKNYFLKKTNISGKKIGEIIKSKTITNQRNEDIVQKKVVKTNRLLKFEPTTPLSKSNLVKFNKSPQAQSYDTTTFRTENLSYESFIERNVYKKNKYVGLIGKPNVISDVFMERDFGSIFERHQRLSDINNLSELTNYKDGYFNVINTF